MKRPLFLGLLSLVPFLLGMTAWQHDGDVYIDELPVDQRAEVHYLSTPKTGTKTANACGWLQWSTPPESFTINGEAIALTATQQRCQNGVVVSTSLRPVFIASGYIRNQKYTLTYTESHKTSRRSTGNCGLIRLTGSTYNLTTFGIVSSGGSREWAIADLPTYYPHHCRKYKNGDVKILVPEGQFPGLGALGVAFTPPAVSPGGSNPPPPPPPPPPVATEPQIPPGAVGCYDRHNITGTLEGGYAVLYTHHDSGSIWDNNHVFRTSLTNGKAIIPMFQEREYEGDIFEYPHLLDRQYYNAYFEDYTNQIGYVLILGHPGWPQYNIFPTPECLY